MPEKVEGATNRCGTCGQLTVCRMTTYADFPNKLQWQNEENNKAHYNQTGKCKNPPQDLTTAGNTTTSEGTLDNTFHPDNPKYYDTTKRADEPTPEEIMAFVKKYCKLTSQQIDQRYGIATKEALLTLIDKAAIEAMMNGAGVKHPSRVSFMGEVMRRLS